MSEITARLPSALACIVMCCAFYSFVSKRFSPSRSFYASLILMSCFEVHRAAMTCRVDMVLTMFIVLAFLALYHWYEKGYKGMPWLASLAISGAILTKGRRYLAVLCSVCVYVVLSGEMEPDFVGTCKDIAIVRHHSACVVCGCLSPRW